MILTFIKKAYCKLLGLMYPYASAAFEATLMYSAYSSSVNNKN